MKLHVSFQLIISIINQKVLVIMGGQCLFRHLQYNASGQCSCPCPFYFSSRVFSHQGAVKPLYWNALCRGASRVLVDWAPGCPTAFVRLFRNALLGWVGWCVGEGVWVGRSRERPQTLKNAGNCDFLCFRFDHLLGAADCKIKKTWDQNTEWVWGLWKKGSTSNFHRVFCII